MRVTNNMLINNMTYNLNSSLKRMEMLQYQTTTGKKFRLPSDDPIGASKSLKFNTDISKIEQYRRNVKDANSWMKETEGALTEINKVLKRASDLTIQAANDTNGTERDKIKAEIEELKGHMIQIGNTTYAGRSIFTGYKTDKDLLDKDGNYNVNLEKRYEDKLGNSVNEDGRLINKDGELVDQDGKLVDEYGNLVNVDGDYIDEDEQLSGIPVSGKDERSEDEKTAIEKQENFIYNVGVSETVTVNILGNQVFGKASFDGDGKLEDDSGYNKDIIGKPNDPNDDPDTPYLIAIFTKLEEALTSSNQEDLQDSIKNIKGAMDNILSVTSEVGAKVNRLELTSSKLDDQALNLAELLSFNEDVDLVEAYMKLNIEQNLYTAGLSVGAKIIQPSLVDFLR